jgi:ArsR family transcriptional regulator
MNEIFIFKALSNPTRIKILELVKNGEKCICEIIPETERSQPTISQHIKILRNAQLIKQRKEGTNIWISTLNKEIFSIIDNTRRITE